MRDRKKITQKSNNRIYVWGVAAVAIVTVVILAAVLFNRTNSNSPEQTVEFPHIHGLGFSSDGVSLYVPAHIGLMVYQDGRWSIPDIPKHDYMGYASVNDGFYSSGHPDLRTDFEPLLGLVKSTDGGASITPLAFEGESDFHLMGAGYESHAVYVYNPTPNSRLQTGIYHSLDDGATWEQSAAQGLGGEPIQIAVHPTNSDIVAVASEGGMFLSTDTGDTFARIGDNQPISSVTFDTEGTTLLFGLESLNAYNVETQEVAPVVTPTLAQVDAISNLTFNPVTGEIAMATFNKDIFLSQNGWQVWQQIAREGVGL